MKRILKELTIIIAAAPLVALAQVPYGGENLASLVERLTNFAILALITVAVLFIVYAAWLFLIGGASPDNVVTAKNILLYAFVAIGVALLARTLIGIAVRIFSPGGGGVPGISV